MKTSDIIELIGAVIILAFGLVYSYAKSLQERRAHEKECKIQAEHFTNMAKKAYTLQRLELVLGLAENTMYELKTKGKVEKVESYFKTFMRESLLKYKELQSEKN